MGRHRASGNRRGRHVAARRIEPYAWFGAGAVTFGVGAALLSGAGVAHADNTEGPSPAERSHTSETGTRGSDRAPAKAAEGGDVGGEADAKAQDDLGDDDVEQVKDSPEDIDDEEEGEEPGDVGEPEDAEEPEDEAELDSGEQVESSLDSVEVSVAGVSVTPPGDENEKENDWAVPVALAVPTAAETSGPVASEAVTVAATPFPVSADIPVGSYPGYITTSRDGRYLYVSNLDGTITKIDRTTNRTVTIAISGIPIEPVVTVDGRFVYLATYGGPGVTVIDTATGTSSAITAPGASRIWMSPDGGTAYVGTSGGLVVIDTRTNSVIGDPIRISYPARDIVISPDSKRLYVLYMTGVAPGASDAFPLGGVEVIDAATGLAIGEVIPVGVSPTAITISTDGSRLYVANLLPPGSPFGTDLSTPGSISVINTATLAVIKDIPVGIRPVHVLASRDGRWVYVVNSARTSAMAYPPMGDLVTIDARTNTTVGQRIPVGFVPYGTSAGGVDGAVLSNDGRRLFVLNVVGVDFPSSGLLGNVQVFDTSAGIPKLLGTTTIGSNPTDIALSPDGKYAYALNSFSALPTDPQSLPNGSVSVIPTGISTTPLPTPTPSPPRRPSKTSPQQSGGVGAVIPAPLKIPSKRVSKPTPQRDLGGAANRAIIELAKIWSDLKGLTKEDWARAIAKDFPEVGRFLHEFIPLMDMLESLVDGSYKVTTGKNPVTGPLKVLSGVAGGVAIRLPLWPPQLIAVKAAFGVISGAISLVVIAIEVVDPTL